MATKYSVLAKIVNSMEKVFPTREPAGEISCSSILKNEPLNLQLVFKNEEEYTLKYNTIKVEGDLSEYISIRNVVLMPVTMPLHYMADDYYVDKNPGMYPDLLKPLDIMGIVLPREQWRAVWASLKSNKDLPVGEHKLVFHLLDENLEEICFINYTVEVINDRLIDTDLKLTNWMHYDCIANYFHVEPFSNDFYKVFDSFIKAYTDCGFNMLYTPLFTPPLDTKVGGERRTIQLVNIKVKNGNYEFDFCKFKKFIKFVLNRNIKYIEFSHLFTQWGGEFCPKIIAEVDGVEKKIFGWETKADSNEYGEFLKVFLTELTKVIKELKIENICYFHLTDEPHLSHYENYKKCNEFVKPYIEDMSIMDAMGDSKFSDDGLVDVPVPVLQSFEQFKDKKMKELFIYNCCQPVDKYYSNRFINMPSQRTRVLGFQLYETGVNGYLHWGFNFYNAQLCIKEIDPYTDNSAAESFPAGDAFIVYPSQEFGVLESIRSNAVMEGFNDYRALKTLEKYMSRDKVLNLLHEHGIEGLNIYPRNSRVHLQIRELINREIKNNI